MNLKNMEYFLTVCASDTITAASEALYVSQQALSQTIKKIEKEVGEKLFVRTNPIELTSAGLKVKETFESILKEYSNLMDTIQQVNPKALVIGYFETQKTTVTHLIEGIKEKYPKIDIVFKQLNSTYVPENIDIILSKKQIEERFQYLCSMKNQLKIWVKMGLENNSNVQYFISKASEL